MFTTNNMDTNMKGHMYNTRAAWVESNKENNKENGPSLFDVTMSRVARARGSLRASPMRNSRTKTGSQRNLHKRKKYRAPAPPVFRRSSFSRTETISTSGMLYPKKKKKPAPPPPSQTAIFQCSTSSKGVVEQVGMIDFADDEPVIAPPPEFSDMGLVDEPDNGLNNGLHNVVASSLDHGFKNGLYNGLDSGMVDVSGTSHANDTQNTQSLDFKDYSLDKSDSNRNQNDSNEQADASTGEELEPGYIRYDQGQGQRSEELALAESGLEASGSPKPDSYTIFEATNNNNSAQHEETEPDHVYATVQKRKQEKPPALYHSDNSDDEGNVPEDIMDGEFPASYVPSVVSASESRKGPSVVESNSNKEAEKLQGSSGDLFVISSSIPSALSLVKDHGVEDPEDVIDATPMLNSIPDTEESPIKAPTSSVISQPAPVGTTLASQAVSSSNKDPEAPTTSPPPPSPPPGPSISNSQHYDSQDLPAPPSLLLPSASESQSTQAIPFPSPPPTLSGTSSSLYPSSSQNTPSVPAPPPPPPPPPPPLPGVSSQHNAPFHPPPPPQAPDTFTSQNTSSAPPPPPPPPPSSSSSSYRPHPFPTTSPAQTFTLS